MYLIIDHVCPKSAWVVNKILYSLTWIINALMLHKWQEEQQPSRSSAGRIVPFSLLAEHLFLIAHIFARFEWF